MAFQLYVQPRGGENIAAGILQAGQAIGQGIRERRDRKEQRKADEGIRDGFRTLVSADPELQASLGITSDEDWDNFSPNQIKGMYEGLKVRAAEGQRQIMETQQNEFARRHAAALAQDQFLADAGNAARNPNAPFSPEFMERIAPILASPSGQFAAEYAAQTGHAPDPAFMERVQGWITPPEQPWQPQVLDMDGHAVLMTSPRSAIPLRGGDVPAEPGTGPKISADGQFFWDDNSNAWKPNRTGPRLDPDTHRRLVTERARLNEQLADIQAKKQDASTWRIMPGPSRQHLEKQESELINRLQGLNAALGGDGMYTQPGNTPAQQASGSTLEFADQEELQAAFAEGRVRPGDTVIVNGRRAQVQ